MPRGQFDWIKENLAAELHVAPQLSTYYYGFNLDRAVVRGHPKLRQALSMAIDRERLASSVLRVGELPAYGWVPPGVYNYTRAVVRLRRRCRSPSASRPRASCSPKPGYTREKPLRFELRYNTGEVHTKVAVAVASMWKEALGVEAQLAAVEFKSLFEDIDRRDVDMYPPVLGRRLQRSVHLPAVPEERLRHQPAALRERRVRRAARRGLTPDRRRAAPRAARAGGAHDARGPPADPAVFLREQAPGEARARRAGTTTS